MNAHRDNERKMRCLCGAPNCVGVLGASTDDDNNNDDGHEDEQQYPTPVAVTSQEELNVDEMYVSAIEAIREINPSAMRKLLGRSSGQRRKAEKRLISMHRQRREMATKIVERSDIERQLHALKESRFVDRDAPDRLIELFSLVPSSSTAAAQEAAAPASVVMEPEQNAARSRDLLVLLRSLTIDVEQSHVRQALVARNVTSHILNVIVKFSKSTEDAGGSSQGNRDLSMSTRPETEVRLALALLIDYRAQLTGEILERTSTKSGTLVWHLNRLVVASADSEVRKRSREILLVHHKLSKDAQNGGGVGGGGGYGRSPYGFQSRGFGNKPPPASSSRDAWGRPAAGRSNMYDMPRWTQQQQPIGNGWNGRRPGSDGRPSQEQPQPPPVPKRKKEDELVPGVPRSAMISTTTAATATNGDATHRDGKAPVSANGRDRDERSSGKKNAKPSDEKRAREGKNVSQKKYLYVSDKSFKHDIRKLVHNRVSKYLQPDHPMRISLSDGDKKRTIEKIADQIVDGERQGKKKSSSSKSSSGGSSESSKRSVEKLVAKVKTFVKTYFLKKKKAKKSSATKA